MVGEDQSIAGMGWKSSTDHGEDKIRRNTLRPKPLIWYLFHMKKSCNNREG
jgi:hypothetical protein